MDEVRGVYFQNIFPWDRANSRQAKRLNSEHVHVIKERDRLGMVVELKVQYCRKNFRIHLIPMRHFYGVQFLNKSVKSFVIFYQLFQSAKETFFNYLKTRTNNVKIIID